jgi:hypothetical protein
LVLSKLHLLPGLAVLLLLHCGGGAAGGGITVDPEPRTVSVGDQLSLTAHPGAELAGDLDWQVLEPYGGGLRNSTGESTVYYAPQAAGTYHLVLRASQTDGRHVKQTVEIQVLPVPSVDPASARVAANGTLQFTATMKGLARNTVLWKVEESGGGDIGEDGRYLAPAKAGTYHVTATSTLDSQAAAQATVVVGD